MFQVGTGDGWMTDVVRPLQEASRSDSVPNVPGIEALITVFFASYILLVYIVLTNVMVSVLLEGFISAFDEIQSNAKAEASTVEYSKIAHKLDPLMASLASYTSPDHLWSMIDRLFLHIDLDRSGRLSYKDFAGAMKRLPYEPRIQDFGSDDWDLFTQGHTLVDEDARLDRKGFEQCILLELQRFSNRMIAHQMNESLRAGENESTMYLAHKMCLMELQKLANKFSANSPWKSNDAAQTGPDEENANVTGGFKVADLEGAKSVSKKDHEVVELQRAAAEQQSTIQSQQTMLNDLCGCVTSIQESVDKMRGLIRSFTAQQAYQGIKLSAESAINVVFLEAPGQGAGQGPDISSRSQSTNETPLWRLQSTNETPPPMPILTGAGMPGTALIPRLTGEVGLQYNGNFWPLSNGVSVAHVPPIPGDIHPMQAPRLTTTIGNAAVDEQLTADGPTRRPMSDSNHGLVAFQNRVAGSTPHDMGSS
jgi:hypothetical protein